MTSDAYLTAEARARVEIDRQLVACGWLVQARNAFMAANLAHRLVQTAGAERVLLLVDRRIRAERATAARRSRRTA